MLFYWICCIYTHNPHTSNSLCVPYSCFLYSVSNFCVSISIGCIFLYSLFLAKSVLNIIVPSLLNPYISIQYVIYDSFVIYSPLSVSSYLELPIYICLWLQGLDILLLLLIFSALLQLHVLFNITRR